VYLEIRKFLTENKVLIFLVDRRGPTSVIIGKNPEAIVLAVQMFEI
jgi:hypothetical protein